ncbi:MAG: beta-lactamase family protein, partial [Pseudomonadales bacterium]|nr:beta-lactamase family protein [Pseudomonadales bacterium]
MTKFIAHSLVVVTGLLLLAMQGNAQHAVLSEGILHLPVVVVGDEQYQVDLEQTFIDDQIRYQLREAESVSLALSDDLITYSDGYLSVPSYQIADESYWAQLKLVNDNPIQFALVASGPQSPEPYDCNSPLIDLSTSSTTGQFQQSGAWKTAVPDQVGVSSQLLDLVTSQLNDGTYTGIDSVLAIKCGFLIYEQYFNGYHSNAVHDLRSTTKSITSGLVGIAIDKGFIESVDLKVAPFLAAYPRVETWTETQQQMTIEDLLTMR